MQKQTFMTAVFIAAFGVMGQLAAQVTTTDALKTRTKSNNANEKTTGWNLKENVKGRVTGTATGCDITFDHEVKSPRDVATGQSSGKRMHKPFSFSVSSSDNAVTENTVASGSSAKSSGGGAGKASFSDLSVMITIKGKSQKLDVTDGEFSLPEDCPDGVCDMIASWSWGATNSSSKKSCSVKFSLQIEEGVCMAINEKGLPGTKTNTRN
jgi:hypothetical protein